MRNAQKRAAVSNHLPSRLKKKARRPHKKNTTLLPPHDLNTNTPLKTGFIESIIKSVKELFGYTSAVPSVSVDQRGNLSYQSLPKSWPASVVMANPSGQVVQVTSDSAEARDMTVNMSIDRCEMKVVNATACKNPVTVYNTGKLGCMPYFMLSTSSPSEPTMHYNSQLIIYSCNATVTPPHLDNNYIDCLKNVGNEVCGLGSQPVNTRDALIAGGTIGSVCLALCAYGIYRRNARRSYMRIPDRSASDADVRAPAVSSRI